MADRRAYDLFVSYADADHEWVEGYLIDSLTQAGIPFVSESAFALGVPRLSEFERAVTQSRRTLLVLSPAYFADDDGQFVDLLVTAYGLETSTWPVIPLILHRCELPTRLAMLTAIDATDPATWESAVARLRAALERPVVEATPAARPACPYPGMAPFGEADRERFFGRDEDVEQALQRLRLHPFLTVIGPSGSGKSSLVFAGLIPALRRSALFGPGDWIVGAFRPGATPKAALSETLAALTDPTSETGKLLADRTATERILIVVDQFEEVFTVAEEEVEAFQTAVLELAATPNCFVVVTVRADFYPELMVSALWPAMRQHRLEVLPLDAAGLRQAIVHPAEDVGVYVEAALVERLTTDAAGEPGALPLVQETLVLLWEKLERRFLGLHAYESLVMPRRAFGAVQAPGRTGLQVAMALRADAALAELSPAQQAIARRVFLRLIQFGEGRSDTRRQQPLAALRAVGDEPALVDATVRFLADRRLLTLTGQAGGADRLVDLAHEALIDGWPQVQAWLTERRAAEQTRRRLDEKAAEWVRLGRGPAGLLDDIELLEAQRWLEGPDADLGVSEDLPKLTAASADAIEAEQAEREAAQRREVDQAKRDVAQRREVEQAQVLAEEQRLRAQDRARVASRLRRLFFAAAVFGVAALVASAVALYGLDRARNEQSRAEDSAATAAAYAEVARQEAVQADAAAFEAGRQREMAEAARGTAETERGRADAERQTAEAASTRAVAAEATVQVDRDRQANIVLAQSLERVMDLP